LLAVTSKEDRGMTEAAHTLISRYYAAFNAQDPLGMLRLLAPDVIHDLNQGGREVGREAFGLFLARMARCYREQLHEIVIMVDPAGSRGAAEYRVLGTYLVADTGLPPARGQTYDLPGGAFFAITGGLINRVTNYYDLQDWLNQVKP
jgi:steroid delta-isomerase-like uncharacterized protein